MVAFLPLIVPATWLLNRYGLRFSILLGAVLNAIGAWIKVISLEFSQPLGSPQAETIMAKSSFGILMLGQVMSASAQVFLLGVPAQLAATWFGEKELALATAIGVFGNQVRPSSIDNVFYLLTWF